MHRTPEKAASRAARQKTKINKESQEFRPMSIKRSVEQVCDVKENSPSSRTSWEEREKIRKHFRITKLKTYENKLKHRSGLFFPLISDTGTRLQTM